MRTFDRPPRNFLSQKPKLQIIECAKLLGLDRREIERAIDRGELRTERVMREATLIQKSDLLAWWQRQGGAR